MASQVRFGGVHLSSRMFLTQAALTSVPFLDDGLCAGIAIVVGCFLSSLIEGFRRVGLEVNLDKT